ncbi:hypothetical protein GWK47_032324 [Chionoecetes opilio]|uniref:Uncharacterized protein n=1 Tax=Chionoecetes opilio TaxID=41210 RepID=A0A8J4YQD1_CHIOP|nr:hypothetical protein GWK47_032324 [Chionoecetes opilio]
MEVQAEAMEVQAEAMEGRLRRWRCRLRRWRCRLRRWRCRLRRWRCRLRRPIDRLIGDKTGQAAAQMNLSDIRKVLGLPPAPFDQEPTEDLKARSRRKSMENMDLLKVSFVALHRCRRAVTAAA